MKNENTSPIILVELMVRIEARDSIKIIGLILTAAALIARVALLMSHRVP